MNWILIGLLILVAFIALIKLSEMKHKLMFKALLFLGVLFLATIVYVYMNSSFNLTTYDGLLGLGKAYMSWLGSLAGNMGTITGYAVQQDWGMGSAINSTINSAINSTINATVIP